MMRRNMPALAAVTLLTGCVSASFKEPVGKFTTAMATANATVRTYFTEMNDFERQMYLKRVLYDSEEEVVAEVGGRQTGLMPVFSAASVKARLDSISLLTAYGEKLAALAGSDAPERFQAGSTKLGANLTSLAGTFQKLSTGGDSSAGRYVGPITTIVGVFGQMALERQRDSAITQAVNEGAPAVEAVLGQLDLDLERIIDPLIETGLLQQLSDATNYYNLNRSTLSFEQRDALLSQIDVVSRRYQAAVTANPSDAIDGIRDAHAALVTYANSSRRPQDLGALIEAIDTFNARLEPVVDAIGKLRNPE